jgi:hypothetical protein
VLGGGGGGQWRGGQGILGPPPQANTAFQGSSTVFDTAGLTAAIQQLAMQGNAWVMDTGASTHALLRWYATLAPQLFILRLL